MTIDFSGQVALVTGAGNGMGRAHALALAERGARVVVIDPGGAEVAGHGGTGDAAKVVAEIQAAGGAAYADATPVGTWEAASSIVARALETWGRVDVLVNNGGIAVAGPIDAMSESDHDRGLSIDLHGPFALTRAVWPTMRAQHYGRIVNVSSSGALGSANTSAYATAKAGLWGLTFDTALEGKEYGIQVNAILPIAWTRMTAAGDRTPFTDWLQRHFPPEPVAAAVVYLAANSSAETGRIFSVGGGRVAEVLITEPAGYINPALTPEGLAEHIAEATDDQDLQVVRGNMDEIQLYMTHFDFDNSASAVAEGMQATREGHYRK